MFRDRADLNLKVNWRAMMENYDVIGDHIEAAVPGFKDFNRRVRVPGGFYLPHSVRDAAVFNTKTKKGRFFAGPIFMNEADTKANGSVDGEWIDITSHFGEQTRTAPKFMVVKYDIPRRCAATYYPEANVLDLIESVVARINTPSYKRIIVTLAPAVDERQLSKSEIATSKLVREDATSQHTGFWQGQVDKKTPNPLKQNLASPGEKVTSGRQTE